MPELYRTRVLELRGTRQELESWLLNIGDMPSLEVMDFVNDDPSESAPPLWHPFKIANFPMLWKVRFRKCSVHWSRHVFATLRLTDLCLEDLPFEQVPSASQFVDILLSLSPTLKNLRLEDALPADLRVVLHPQVALPNLVVLQLVGSMRDIRALCSLLHLPGAVTMLVFHRSPEGIYIKTSTWAEQSIISYLLDDLPNQHELRITLIHKENITCSSTSNLLPDPDFPLLIEEAEALTVGLLPSSRNALRSTSDFSSKAEYDLWKKGLPNYASVQRLRILCTTPPMFLESLLERAMLCVGVCMCPSIEHIAEDGSTIRHLPDLRHIILHRVDFEHIGPASNIAFFDVLIAFIWARRIGHARILKVDVIDCKNIREQYIGRLRYFVDVNWDKKGFHEDGMSIDPDLDERTAAIRTFGYLKCLRMVHGVQWDDDD